MVWGKIVLFVVAIFVLIFIFNTVMAKVLNVEKKKVFSRSYVNELHKKIEGILSITFIVVIIILNFRQIESPGNSPWFFIGIFIIYFVIENLVRAIIEWKYATNRKDYIYTLSETLFMTMIFFAFTQTNFLGLING